MKTYKVTLLVTPNEGEDRPSKWDWQELLGCDVEQVSVEEVKPSLYDQCSALYHASKDGQAAVEKFIKENHPEVPWLLCAACEANEPCQDNTCLVCGSAVKDQRFVLMNTPTEPEWCANCGNAEPMQRLKVHDANTDPHYAWVCDECGCVHEDEDPSNYQCIDPKCPSAGTYHDHKGEQR